MKKRSSHKKKSSSPDGEISYTVCGEFFPEIYPAFRSQKWSRGMEDPLTTEMRLFCSCERWAFNRLLEGTSRDDVKKRGQEIFGINSRYADGARLKAKAVIDSQEELLEIEVDETESKLARARKKLGQAMRKLARAEEKGAAPEEIEKFRLAVNGKNTRVVSLERKLTELKEHQENGTIPKVVFGGKKLWKKVCRRRTTREEWRAVRKNRLYTQGDETKGGNPHFKVSCKDGQFRLAVTISHLSEQVGVDAKGRPKMTRAPKVEGRLWLPEKHRDMVRIWLAMGLPYTVELIRTVDGRYLVHLTFSLSGVPEPDFAKGCLSVDTNPDGLGLCNVGPTGQPEPWPEDFSVPYPPNLGKYEGEFQVVPYPNGFMYICIPDLEYARGFRRTYLIGRAGQGCRGRCQVFRQTHCPGGPGFRQRPAGHRQEVQPDGFQLPLR